MKKRYIVTVNKPINEEFVKKNEQRNQNFRASLQKNVMLKKKAIIHLE